MKRLFVPGLFSTLLLLFTSCDTPAGMLASGISSNAIDEMDQALKKAKAKKAAKAAGNIKPYYPGFLGAQDTYYVGTIKGVGRIYQQTFIDGYTKTAQAKLYDCKTAQVAVDLLNDRVIPFYEEHGIRILRILTDRSPEYGGRRKQDEYQLYLYQEYIVHTKTKGRSPQTKICIRFHRTCQEEFYNVAFRKKSYSIIEEIQQDLDAWLECYNKQRTHPEIGKIPYQAFLDGLDLAKEKMRLRLLMIQMSDNS